MKQNLLFCALLLIVSAHVFVSTFAENSLLLGKDSISFSDSIALEEVIIATTHSQFATEKTGMSKKISLQEIKLLPTINRSISDVTRLSPYASGMNFGGRDGRSNNITVDGARLNNNFGLNSDLPGGGNPVSLDAIEEVRIAIAPYDVRQANFIGAGIDVVTKSGTNWVKGSVYTCLYNEKMRGNAIGDIDFGKRPEEAKNIYGVSLGGPIVKNRLFFFVNVETEKSPGQITQWRASKDGIADAERLISRTSEADLDEFSQILENKYGYKTGSYKDFPGGITDFKISGRLDWNIDADNRFSIRYNHVKNDNWTVPNATTAETGYTLPSDRISQYGMSYFNSCYSVVNQMNTLTVELNSRWEVNQYNQVLVTYTDMKQGRDTRSAPFPFIDIMKDGNPYMSAGYELFTWNTETTNQVVNVVDNFTFYADNHKLTAGMSYEDQIASTSYMSNGLGYYRYSSFADFKNGAAPESFALTYGYNDVKQAGVVSFAQLAGYLQDEWSLRDNLTLTAGIRFDQTNFLNDMLRNQAIYDLNFGGKHVDTSLWPSSASQVSPRIGVAWDVFDDQVLKIRGGSGIFTGRTPMVYLANMPVSAGMYQNMVVYRGAKDRDQLDKLQGGLLTEVPEMIEKFDLPAKVNTQGIVPSSISGVDPHFKMPQVWKTSLGTDYTVPVSFPLTLTVEGMFSKDINAIRLINYNVEDETNALYYTSNPKGAYILTNTHEGWGYTGNVTLNAVPVKNLNLMVAYTHTESKEISGMPSSTASSAWSRVPSVNGPNFSQLERSQYVTPDRIIGSLTYHFPYLKNRFSTDIGMFYAGYSPYSYSYMYTNDRNGDGISNDLIYIPKDKNDITFITPEDENLFWNFLENDKYLSKHKGQYAGAYAVNAPWVHRFDLKIAQNFSVKAGKSINTLQVSVDILNIGNLLHNTWGVYQNMTPANDGRILKYEGKDANNVPLYSFFSPKKIDSAFARYNNSDQTWKLQLGVRYIFN